MFNKCELLLIITIIDYDCDCRGRVSLEEGVRVQEGRRMGTEFTFHLDYDPEKGRKCFFSFLFFSFFLPQPIYSLTCLPCRTVGRVYGDLHN